MIRTVKDSDYDELVKLYKKFFTVHNIFQKSKEDVIKYLKKQAEKDEFLVYYDNKIKGALFLCNFGQNIDGSHKLWKFRHFAFEDEKVAKSLLLEAEKRIKGKSKTAKVELTIAENEEGIEFYKKNGYKQEASLSNHYRFGETCFILAKSFSN